MSIMQYQTGKNEQQNWLIEESQFDVSVQGKCEATFCQGNGYLGLRHALEEAYVGQTRGLFITGTFNKFDQNEVTELPNCPDVTNMELYINGVRFSMTEGTVENYHRVLNLKNGEVIRTLNWTSPKGDVVGLEFSRVVSLADQHLITSKVAVTAVSGNISVKLVSAINGAVTNSGAQHFSEGPRRIYDGRLMEYTATTGESDVTIALQATHHLLVEGVLQDTLPNLQSNRRYVGVEFLQDLQKGETIQLEKMVAIHTTRDLQYDGKENALDCMLQDSRAAGKALYNLRYDMVRDASAAAWDMLWQEQDIAIDTEHPFDQLAMRFALYHLNIMVQKKDNRVGIAAKGLSGEGYKGHSFWDTETFILPYFIMAEPTVARTLLEYRYKNLYGARKKALEYGLEGAMYPWESAWVTDGEVTPIDLGVDIITGKPIKCLTGMIELHVTADIAIALLQYYKASGDEDFMERYGYEILIETARFWNARLEWNGVQNRYEINDVIGPDEYKEHVNNNAYTNYLLKVNMQEAVAIIERLQAEKPAVYTRLDAQIGLQALKASMLEKLPLIYLPQPDEKTGIIPQFDGYFDLKEIDLTPYKQSAVVGTIYQDYSAEELNDYKVAKQADVVELFYQLDGSFDEEIKRKNYFYYEARTLHDSSLSRAIHSVLACDLGMVEDAYEMFMSAAKIDLGEEMRTSNAGIHSASMGGIWQDVVMGFGGVRVIDGKLRLAPRLPKAWNRLQYPIWWQGSRLVVTVTKETISVENLGAEVSVMLAGEAQWIKANETVTKSYRAEV